MRPSLHRAICTTLALVAVAVSLTVLGERLTSAIHAPDFGSINDHPDAVYGVWKIQHGLPLYEECLSGDYNVELFNFGFYHLYARVLGVFGVRDENLLRTGKYLSLTFALLGSLAQLLTIRALLGPEPWRRWWPVVSSAVVLLWFAFTNWFVFSVRCDMSAMAFTAWALWIYLRFAAMPSRDDPRAPAALVAASVLFAAAWSCKQVYVWSFSSLVLLEFLRGGPRRWLALAGPFAGIIVASLLVGGRLYWENTLVAPSANVYVPKLVLQQAVKATAAYPFIFLFAVIGIVWWWRRTGGCGLRARLAKEPVGTALVFVALGTTTMNLLSFGREGGIREHIFEAALTLTTLAVVTLINLVEGPGTVPPEEFVSRGGWRWTALAAATFAATALLPLTQLFAYGNLSSRISRFNPDFVPRPPTLYEHADDYERLQKLAVFAAGLPRPCFTYGILSLPWFTNGNQYPALIIVSDVHGHLLRRGRLRGDGCQEFYRQRRVGSLLLDGNDRDLIADVLRHGYRVVPLPTGLENFSGHAVSVAGGSVPVALVREGD